MRKKDNIYFLGDTHGSTTHFFYMCKRSNLTDITVFHVGDFGVGFLKDNEKWLATINNKLAERNITMYVIRGNHDDPFYFKGGHKLSHLKLVPDYTTLKIGSRRFLLVGGAISVDRIHRISGESWWKDEVFNLDTNRLKRYRGITDVITHSAPDYVPPLGPLPSFIISNSRRDSSLLSEIRLERFRLSTMADILVKNNDIKNWYYGHFHFSEKFKVGNINFKLLDVNELI